jgi:cytochrome c peroxidase
MPQMSGLDVQEHLNLSGAMIPIILMTGHADVPMAVQAMKSGAFDFLEKPFRNQALLDCVNAVEMGSRWEDVVARLAAIDTYDSAFNAAYKDGVTKANIANAIASYERTLVTPDSRFDRYLRGDDQAISAAEKLGYAKFKQYGCVACHQGVNVGGNMFQKFGVMGDYFAERGAPTDADLGRYRVTKEESDRNVFKVPSLRNVAVTAPYFHDGHHPLSCEIPQTSVDARRFARRGRERIA